MIKDKFFIAVKTLNANANYTYQGSSPTTEEEYNNVNWISGVNEQGEDVFGNAPSELTWAAIKAEMDKL
tara:strand:- start:43 stop:249 length:207 start_codon:yes stop_codon:yes gene_type:complete